MPKLRKKIYPSKWDLSLGAAAGPSIYNFFILAESRDYNETFAWKNPDTFQSPTSCYTYIIHYIEKEKRAIYRVPDLLIDLWYSSSGKAYACGFPRSLFEIDAKGLKEIVMKGHSGAFSGIWGFDEDHLFVCGFAPFILYRQFGNWKYLVLPEGTPDDLYGVVGLSERDVYFVGGEGTILHFNGQKIRRLETPTTDRLLSIAILSDKYVCVGGIYGMLLHGNQFGWRLVPTETEVDLDSLAHFKSCVCFPTPEGIWAYDGHRRPTLLIDTPAEWVSGLNDGIMLRDGKNAWLYDSKILTKLDTILHDPGP